MKLFAVVLTFCIVLAFSTTVVLAGQNDAWDAEKIEEFVEGEMDSYKVPGLSLAIVKGDQVIYSKGFGIADSNHREVTAQTPFLLASVSKTFTALAIMQLAEHGKLDLDQPVQYYLPYFSVSDEEASSKILIRHLLSMRSGIPVSAGWERSNKTREQLIRSKAGIQLSSPVGSQFEYSNYNYILLGAIIESVSGMSFEEYITENIFVPLEMENSYVSGDKAQRNGLSAGYQSWLTFPVRADLPYFENVSPSTGIISCAEDMAHYLIMCMNGGKYKGSTIISPDGLKTLTTPTNDSSQHNAVNAGYCMGWGSFEYDGLQTIEGIGEAGNYYAHVIFTPEEGIGVILMQNLGGSFTPYHIAPGISSLLAGKELPQEHLNIQLMRILLLLLCPLLLALLILMLARIKRWHRKFNEASPRRRIVKIVMLVLVHFMLPALILTGLPVIYKCPWNAYYMFSPDAAVLLLLTSGTLVVAGIIKAVLSFSSSGYFKRRVKNT